MSRVSEREEEDNDILDKRMHEGMKTGQHLPHDGCPYPIRRLYRVTEYQLYGGGRVGDKVWKGARSRTC